MAKTLENFTATPMLHRPSIRHRDGETNHRCFVPNSVKPSHQAKANGPQDRDLGSQESSETDLRGDRSQMDRFLANITHLVSEVFAPEIPQSHLLSGQILGLMTYDDQS